MSLSAQQTTAKLSFFHKLITDWEETGILYLYGVSTYIGYKMAGNRGEIIGEHKVVGCFGRLIRGLVKTWKGSSDDRVGAGEYYRYHDKRDASTLDQ